MHRRNVLGIAVSGLTGSVVLLGILYTLPKLMFIRDIDILRLLGTFVTDGAFAPVIGTALFFAAGFLAAAGYVGLWRVGIGRPTAPIGMLFGFGHGLFAIAALQIAYALHPSPPPIYMTAGKSLVTLIGHLAFGVLLATVYRPFAEQTTGETVMRRSAGATGG